MNTADFALHYRLASVLKPLADYADAYDANNTTRPDRAADVEIAREGNAVVTLAQAFEARELLKELLAG